MASVNHVSVARQAGSVVAKDVGDDVERKVRGGAMQRNKN